MQSWFRWLLSTSVIDENLVNGKCCLTGSAADLSNTEMISRSSVIRVKPFIKKARKIVNRQVVTLHLNVETNYQWTSVQLCRHSTVNGLWWRVYLKIRLASFILRPGQQFYHLEGHTNLSGLLWAHESILWWEWFWILVLLPEVCFYIQLR